MFWIPTDFVNTGKSKAVVSITLSNKGQGSYKREIFGDSITVERTINASTGSGGYKILNAQSIILQQFLESVNYYHFCFDS